MPALNSHARSYAVDDYLLGSSSWGSCAPAHLLTTRRLQQQYIAFRRYDSSWRFCVSSSQPQAGTQGIDLTCDLSFGIPEWKAFFPKRDSSLRSTTALGPPSQKDLRRLKKLKRNYTDGMENLSQLSQSLYARIKDDLKPWEEIGITQEMVEHTYCTVLPPCTSQNFCFLDDITIVDRLKKKSSSLAAARSSNNNRPLIPSLAAVTSYPESSNKCRYHILLSICLLRNLGSLCPQVCPDRFKSCRNMIGVLDCR